ncbi:MAG: family 20 glycosylhydrolase [Clostridia bacterium]|nr:family 20 glycosylhydrolase [Clostridia bacterium]
MQSWSPEKLALAMKHVENVTDNPHFPSLKALVGPGLSLSLKEGEYTLTCEDMSSLCRGLFLLQESERQGQNLLATPQTRHFSHVGVMLDMSRNAVMKPEAVCAFIDRMACLGMNMLMLYTEDTYTVKGYPTFGYLRGRYTIDEMKSMDAYALEVGVELVPCIQTLAHLKTFLAWDSSAVLRDQMDILLIDEPETEKLIRAMIATLRECFHSRRIHIGMDEAHAVGLGAWRAKHGETDRFALLSRHLNLVSSICREYDFAPMMWSDMFFRLGSRHGEYYDRNAEIPQSVIDTLPDVGMVYWDYYHTDESMYDHMLTQHERMGTPIFAGGIWTWSGFVPHIVRTRATTVPALRVCARHQVDTVFATLWGDDGGETDYSMALSQFAYLSEYCWRGEDASESDIRALGSRISGLESVYEDVYADFYPGDMNHFIGKKLVWADPLLPLACLDQETLQKARDKAAHALSLLHDVRDCDVKFYLQALFTVVSGKAALLASVRDAYIQKDRDALDCCLKTVRALQGQYRALHDAHRTLWNHQCKRFGFELLAARYGGAIQRLSDVAKDMEAYLEGGLSQIEELEATPLPEDPGYAYRRLITAGQEW